MNLTGNKAKYENYRGIIRVRLDIAYEVVMVGLRNKLDKIVDKLLQEYQAGLRSNMFTTDEVFVLKQMIAVVMNTS